MPDYYHCWPSSYWGLKDADVGSQDLVRFSHPRRVWRLEPGWWLHLIFRVWLVIRAADRNLTPFGAARDSQRPSRTHRPSAPQKPTRTRRKPAYTSKNLLCPNHEYTSFLP